MGRAVAAVTSQLGIPKSLKDRRKFAFSGQVSLEGASDLARPLLQLVTHRIVDVCQRFDNTAIFGGRDLPQIR